MAKRFFDTQQIEQDWYLELSLKERELLRYCESKADQAGIFPFSEKIASTYVGVKVTATDFKNLPISVLPNGKYFIHGFCYLQNGNLTDKCNAHKPVFKSLDVNKIDEGSLLGSLPVRLQEKKKDIELELDKEVEPPKIGFEKFWELYPRKEGKKNCIPKWDRLKTQTQQKILDTLPKFLEGKDLQFVPMPETYFNKERWDDEVVVSTQSSPPILEAKRTSLEEAQALKDSFG